MPVRITDGKDPLTKAALEYLFELGIPLRLITRIQVDSPMNDVQRVTVTLLVDARLVPDPDRALRERTVAVPIIGQTRDELPVRTPGAALREQPESHAPQVCTAMTLTSATPDGRGHITACHQPIRWFPPPVPDALGVWAHVDASLDAQHEAVLRGDE